MKVCLVGHFFRCSQSHRNEVSVIHHRLMFFRRNKRNLCRSALLGSVVITVLMSAFSLGETPGPEPRSGTGIDGAITVGPIHGGPSRAGVPDSKPLANVGFVVKRDNDVVASFSTDAQGRFRVSLPPGHYTVSRTDGQPKLGRCGPFDVDVVATQMTPVNWSCDTGMR